MKKLSLRVDELRVETFGTDAPAAERGTVRANQESVEFCDTQDRFCTEPTGPGFVTFPAGMADCVIC